MKKGNHFIERSTRAYTQEMLFSKEELERREGLCVYESPPYCSAACPMKLDVRLFAEHMADGRFNDAAGMLEHITPLPGVLAAGCEGPCCSACRLKELGDGSEPLNVPALERAALRLARDKKRGSLLKFTKKIKTAVFGGDLFTLALACELAGKSYPIAFHVAEASVEELFEKYAPFLTGEDLTGEINRVKAMDIDFVFDSDINKDFYDKRDDYDIVGVSPELYLQLTGRGTLDSVTLYDGELGTVSRPENEGGVLQSLFDARRAAVSFDRLAQKMDPGQSRGEEGPVESRLYTNLEGIMPSQHIPENEGFDADAARAEAVRCIQCRCEDCLNSCAYLKHYGKHPRILTREIYNNVGIIMGDHMMNKALNSCSLCGQCTVVCPNGYDMGDICQKARENMVHTDKLSLAVHEFALLDMLFSNDEAFLAKNPPGKDACEYMFFPGCQMGSIAPEVVKAVYRDMTERMGLSAGLMLGCCGEIAKWAGRTALFEEQRQQLLTEWEKLGRPVIVAACPSCRNTLEEITGERVLGIWDIYLEKGLPEGAPAMSDKIKLHDACGARGKPEIQEAVRRLLGSIGADFSEDEWSGDKSKCCGYGGLVSYANRELAGEMARDALGINGPEEDTGSQDNADNKITDDIHVTYCMACRDRYAGQGAKSLHILELITGERACDTPDISARRYNRLMLKQQLLSDIWKEETPMEKRDYILDIPEAVRETMNDRMILESDVLEVFDAYRENGEAVRDEETGFLTARARIGNVTFWVIFTPIEGGYRLEGAYSHRMTIVRRFEG